MRPSRRLAVWSAVLTVALMVVLRPLAYAGPIDPSWISGIYDGADFDDVAHFIATSSAADGVQPAIHHAAPRVPDPGLEGRPASPAAAPGSSSLTRAPPLPFAPPV